MNSGMLVKESKYMPTESQNIDSSKESWRDECQRMDLWLCQCTRRYPLYVGVKDNGEVCGVQDAKKLMEDIPQQGARHDGHLSGS